MNYSILYHIPKPGLCQAFVCLHCESRSGNASSQSLPCVRGGGAKRRRGCRCVKKICQRHIFSIRSRRLCRRSIHLDLLNTILTDNPPVTLRLTRPVAVPKISLRHKSRRNFDRCHSLTSLFLPLAALGSLPPLHKGAFQHVVHPSMEKRPSFDGRFSYLWLQWPPQCAQLPVQAPEQRLLPCFLFLMREWTMEVTMAIRTRQIRISASMASAPFSELISMGFCEVDYIFTLSLVASL